jgi:hypothetical protein
MGLKFELRIEELTDERILAELSALQEKHGVTNDQFLDRYHRGELGCCIDFIDWAGLLSVATEAGLYCSPDRPA